MTVIALRGAKTRGRTCSTLFMKHVLPRLLSPRKPANDAGLGFMPAGTPSGSCSAYMSSRGSISGTRTHGSRKAGARLATPCNDVEYWTLLVLIL